MVERVSRADEDRRTLGRMVVDELHGRLQTVVLSYSSYSPILFLQLMRAIEVMRQKPLVIIFPVNLRSFSPQWDLQPYWQFEEEQDAIKAFIASPGSKIKPVRNKNVNDVPPAMMETFKNTAVSYPLSDFKKIGEFVGVIESEPGEDSGRIWRKKQIFIFHYMHPLRAGHRQLNALQEILSLVAKLNAEAFLYITPINVRAGERFVGAEFRQQIDSNVDVIEEAVFPYLKSGRIRFSDWNALFDSQFFFDADLATEHLNETGRRELARRIRLEVCRE